MAGPYGGDVAPRRRGKDPQERQISNEKDLFRASLQDSILDMRRDKISFIIEGGGERVANNSISRTPRQPCMKVDGGSRIKTGGIDRDRRNTLKEDKGREILGGGIGRKQEAAFLRDPGFGHLTDCGNMSFAVGRQ